MFPVESIIPGIRASLEANRDVVLRAPAARSCAA